MPPNQVYRSAPGDETAIADRDDMAPPWAKYPEIQQGSLGWRMGTGEDWLMNWHDWIVARPADRAQRIAYLGRHPPAPRNWADTARWVVDPGAEGDARTALNHELVALGLVADDVAILAWLALHDPPAPPWREGSPADAVRYEARALNFFVRWALRQRADDRLEPWLAAAPRPLRAWRAFHDALRSGQVNGPLPRAPRHQLAILLAAMGDPPPPWTRGEPPTALARQFEDRTTYAGAWFEWAFDSFDDLATWRAYLQRVAPPPPEWEDAVRDEFAWL